MANSINFYHVYRTLCSVDGAAYFGVAISNDPYTYPDGYVLGEGRQLKAHIEKHGIRFFSTIFTHCFPLEKDANAKVEQLIKAHPGPRLNWTNEEKLRMAVAAVDPETRLGNRNAAGSVRTEAHMKAIVASHEGSKWYYNLNTKHELFLKKGEEIPPGYVRGRLPGQKRIRKPLTK